MLDNLESIQILNTAIIKTKEKKIDHSYEERLKKTCDSEVLDALNKAITGLSENKKISRDQAASLLVETIRDLDSIWNDYVMMEGIAKLKDILRDDN